MKFTEGYWRMKPKVSPLFPVHVQEVEADSDSLTVYAPTRLVSHRGDTISLPVLTLRLSSPMENVIRIGVFHFKGGKAKKPEFGINIDKSTQVRIQNGAEEAILTSGRLSAAISKGKDWRLEFRDGEKVITNSGWRNMGIADSPEGRFAFEQLALGVGECVYGLGERFTAFVKNGQVVEIWNGDGGTSSEIAYKNIPFYMTNRGYGVFVNHPERVSFEVASEKVERVQFSVAGECLEYFLIYGPEPKQVLERYTALTGHPALPPAWSFGLWLTTSFVTDYDEKTVTGFIQGMADRDIPLHVFHFDCFWMKGFRWVDFQWDKDVFPDPEAMLKRLKERGLRVCVWINPYVAQRSPMFDEGMEGGYLIKKKDGSVWQTDSWQAGMGIVDFTNPAAREWYRLKLKRLLDMGVDCFKTDFGEVIPTEDVSYFDGSDPQRMHNYYTWLYNEAVFSLLEERFGKGRAAVFARSATAGGQAFPIHWGGDSTATFESMAESLRGGLSLGLSGFGYWSHDIGGFELTASSDVYKRWCAFGLLSSHSRLHGNASYRVPWAYDDPEATDVLRFFTKLKCRLMPYLFRAACEAHERGIPMMRAMLLEFPGEPGCDTLDRQYMLGSDLLVAPIFTVEGSVDFYLPEGEWTSLLSGKILTGGRWIREKHDYSNLPLLARPNSVIPMGNREDTPEYDYAEGVCLNVFRLAEGKHEKVEIRSATGEIDSSFELERKGREVLARRKIGSKPWRILLRGMSETRSIEGGKSEPRPEGVLIEADGAELKICL